MVMTFTCNYRLHRQAGWSALRPAIFIYLSQIGEINVDNDFVHLGTKNSWSQGRPSRLPVQSIVTCECHNHVVSV
jgi:hypothetical protein